MPLKNRLAAECLGTFWLVLGGCGAAVLNAGIPSLGIGYLGVALAFGLSVLTMAYAIGHISGCHLNPAVTLGLATGKRFPWNEAVPYIITQLIGGILGAAVLYVIATGKEGFDAAASGFASTGYGEHSPEGYTMGAGLVTEMVLTFIFLIIIMGSTDRLCPPGVRTDRHRAGSGPDPLHRAPGDQPLSQPRPQHRDRRLRPRVGAAAALAVLGRADHRRHRCRHHLSDHRQRTFGGRAHLRNESQSVHTIRSDFREAGHREDFQDRCQATGRPRGPQLNGRNARRSSTRHEVATWSTSTNCKRVMTAIVARLCLVLVSSTDAGTVEPKGTCRAHRAGL